MQCKKDQGAEKEETMKQDRKNKEEEENNNFKEQKGRYQYKEGMVQRWNQKELQKSEGLSTENSFKVLKNEEERKETEEKKRGTERGKH